MKRFINDITPPFIKRFFKRLISGTIRYNPRWIVLEGKYAGGIKFYLDPRTKMGKTFLHDYDAFMYDQLIQFPRHSGGIYLDIGAHMGYHTLGFARLAGENGKVYAFEPHPFNRERLSLNIHENPELAGRITVIDKALSHSPGTATFEMLKNLWEGVSSASKLNRGSIKTNKPVSYVELITVEVDTIDRLLATGKISAPDFMKIDVEGEEFNVLRGAENALIQHHPTILVEVHDIENMYHIMQFLPGINYHVTLINKEADGRCFLYCTCSV